jgi:hypothetical protein
MKKIIGILAQATLSAIIAIALTGTGLVIASGGGGGGASLATLLPGTSADLRAALSDETGTGAAVFAAAPTLTGAVVVTGPTGSLSVLGAVAITGATTVDGDQAINNVGALTVRQGGSTGSLRAPSSPNAAIIAQGRGANRGLVVTSGNTASSTAATFEATGIAVEIVGDTTSPARASVRLTPLDADPTDIYATTAGVLKICTATTPTWVNVGSQ